jgi:hypothetical protein
MAKSEPEAVTTARQELDDPVTPSRDREWRSFVRAPHLARAVLAMYDEIKQLRARMNGICDAWYAWDNPENMNDMIAEVRELADKPKDLP